MTKPLVVSIPHHLGKAEAKRRLRTGLEQLKVGYAQHVAVIDDVWTDDRLDFRVRLLSQTVTGLIDVGEDQVTLAVELPWVLAILAEKAKGLIQKQGLLMLEKK